MNLDSKEANKIFAARCSQMHNKDMFSIYDTILSSGFMILDEQWDGNGDISVDCEIETNAFILDLKFYYYVSTKCEINYVAIEYKTSNNYLTLYDYFKDNEINSISEICKLIENNIKVIK